MGVLGLEFGKWPPAFSTWTGCPALLQVWLFGRCLPGLNPGPFKYLLRSPLHLRFLLRLWAETNGAGTRVTAKSISHTQWVKMIIFICIMGLSRLTECTKQRRWSAVVLQDWLCLQWRCQQKLEHWPLWPELQLLLSYVGGLAGSCPLGLAPHQC